MEQGAGGLIDGYIMQSLDGRSRTAAYDGLLPSHRRTARTAPRETPPDPAGEAPAVGAPATSARTQETFAAAQVLIGDPASGLSRTTDRTLWRHVSAHARGDETALPRVRRVPSRRILSLSHGTLSRSQIRPIRSCRSPWRLLASPSLAPTER